MGEQIKVPEGWKVEIRVRKSGRKDRYYVDPANGYIFRSLKDIDRYLLTGKLGRHVTKTKQKDLEYNAKLNIIPPLDASKEKKCLKPQGIKKSCLESQEKKLSGEKSVGEDTGHHNSKEEITEKNSRPPNRRASTSSRKKDASPFFILDPDQCEDGNAADIPNLSEILDTMQKEKEGHNTVYLSAPAIGALLRAQLTETRIKQETSPNFNVSKVDLRSRNNPYQNPTAQETHSRTVDTKSKERGVLAAPLFGDLMTDPCIDFAIKTLTDTVPYSSGPSPVNRCLQQQIGSMMILREGNPWQN